MNTQNHPHPLKNSALSEFLMPVLLMASLLLPFSSAQAELVTNGSLDGAIGNNALPLGWFAGSTNAVKPNSPDIMNQSNNVGVTNLLSFAATPTASKDGGTWVGIGTNGNLVNESFSQTISNFEVGEEYEISWYEANFGYKRRGYIGDNKFVADLDGLTDDQSFTGTTMRSVSEGWTLQTFSFIPKLTEYTLSFKLAGSAKSYLSIDGISIKLSEIDRVTPNVTAVPEPESYAMMLAGLGILGFSVRRRKS